MARIVSVKEWEKILALKHYSPYYSISRHQHPDFEGFEQQIQQLFREGVFNLGEPGFFYLECHGVFVGERLNIMGGKLNPLELFFADRESAENFIKARGGSDTQLLQVV